jgi:hypothetical protein
MTKYTLTESSHSLGTKQKEGKESTKSRDWENCKTYYIGGKTEVPAPSGTHFLF